MNLKNIMKVLLGITILLIVLSLFLVDGTSFGVWSLLPPLVAILLAFISKQVILSLFLGIFTGAMMLVEGNVFDKIFHGFINSFGEIVGSVADGWNAGILIFTLMIGGMIGVIARTGGTRAIANALAKKAKTARSAQIATMIMGVAVFFDDYANTLVVGPTMRPLTDKMKVSREKLSYIVDSTAAPVAGMALISTWVGYELGLINDAFEALGMNVNAYEVFIKSIPFRFYDIFALVMVFLVAYLMRDFGPMYHAEKRARLEGKVLADGAQPMANTEMDAEEASGNVWNALAPILTLVIVSFLGLWYSGGGTEEAFDLVGIRNAFGNADASVALIWGAALGSIVAIVMAIAGKLLSLNEAFDAWVNGFKSLVITAIILTLAWSLGSVTGQVDAAGYLVGALSGSIAAGFVPFIVFLFAMLIAFATGTSWGTMAILMPLAIPLAHELGVGDMHLIYATLGSVLTGSIFGDHCSPISDTTIMSSMASAADHIDHVKTQMPYALTTAAIAAAVGYIPAGFGLTPWVSLPIGIIAIFLVLKFVGKSVKEEDLKA